MLDQKSYELLQKIVKEDNDRLLDRLLHADYLDSWKKEQEGVYVYDDHKNQ